MHPRDLAARRRQRAQSTDRRLRRLLAEAVSDRVRVTSSGGGRPGHGLALVAVGGYGRAELSPASDVDVVLVHKPGFDPGLLAEIADAVWYPLWDEAVALDHAVRSTEDMISAASADHRSAAGMLDARAVAGDRSVVLALRSTVLAQWRRDARRRVPELREANRVRVERAGWLAEAAEPDLKESGGGLRDGIVMRSLVATWLVDIPHAETERLRSALLDVRDVLHEASGRRSDRLTHDILPDVAAALGMAPSAVDLHVRDLGRRMAHLSALAWRRVEDVLAPAPSQTTGRRSRGVPRLPRLADGVAELNGEVVLAAGADPGRDPALGLRAAACAARRGVPLSASAAVRLADATVPSTPWNPEMRRLLVDLLAAGTGLVRVWDELDFAGVVAQWLPEWDAIRLRGSSSPVHTLTIDRHSIETCLQAAHLLRDVRRPDLLVVAALLHDIGKGRDGDHSEIGAPLARDIARRWGFIESDADSIALLVRWHLLLPTTATRRDIEDPATAANVAQIVRTTDTLTMLAALTEADARAAGPTAWTSWRAGLVRGLVAKTRDHLGDTPGTAGPGEYEGWPIGAAEPGLEPPAAEALTVTTRPHHDGSLIQISASDRAGLMADLAGGLALAGLQIRSARVLTQRGVASSLWETTRAEVDPAGLQMRLRKVLDGSLDLASRLSVPSGGDRVPPIVTVLPVLSPTATVIEVRARDRRGLVWSVCRSISAAGWEIRSAHLSTFGPEARDVFYVVDGADGASPDERAERLCQQVAAALA